MPQFSGPTDPAADARWPDAKPRKGFFTVTSICIGCKACEVACKEWNHNPRDGDLELLGSSYDNTGALGASTWRHVAFIEQKRDRIEQAQETGRALVNLGMPRVGAPKPVEPTPASAAPGDTTPPDTPEFRWLMSSDVSALTRFGVFEAGIASAKDPRYTIEPQKRRLAARRAAGITDDSITTAG